MQQKVNDPRVDKMAGSDRSWSAVAILTLWALYVFVLWEVLPHLGDDPRVFWALAISGGLVLLFNTAAVIAMLSHFSEDREHIYGLDLHYLDLMKRKG